ncbi:hypothetical protein Tco_1057246 [Tanacetum coccineum]|uniref:Uncharacterized protein n=1 Tax=Tanacetum coccineum TaxID=301880 RepID=A0ABQ5H658_9ASTR
MYSKDVEEEGSDSESDDANLTGSRVESSKQNKLKQFDFITKNGKHIHLTAEQIKEQKKLEDLAKADRAKQEVVLGKEELVDLLGIDVVTKYYKAKFQYDKYCDKLLNRRAQSRIINYDVLTRKGPITLRGVQGGWMVHHEQIHTRMNYLHKSEEELGIDLDKPLSEQDPLDKLNDLAKKKRKNAEDIHDYFRANKKLKSSVQYEDHPAGTMLNEPVLGTILFNSFHRQDFVPIEDFRDFPNEMLYTVQEIFFRLHQGPRLDDHASTISSLLLAEVNKRNLNPFKQMRVIEQLRQ